MNSFMKKSVLFVCCFIISAALVKAEDWEKVRTTIEETNNQFEKAIVAGDFDKLNIYYTDDVISLPSFEPEIRGIDNMKKKNEANMKSGFKITACDFKTTDVFGSGDVAIEVGQWNMTMIMPGSDQPMNDVGKYLTVWQKQSDGSWKVKAETWNTNSNPMMMSEGAGETKDTEKEN